MAKRIAGTKASIAVAVLVLLQPFTCFAYSAENLYSDFDIEYSSPYNEDDLDVIRNYNYAKRYATMFRYVAESTYDVEVINNRIAECEKTIETIEKELISGYDKSDEELYQLESDYNTALQQLEEAKNTTEPVDVDVTRLSAEEVPTYEEYVRAMNRKRSMDKNCELGKESKIVLSLNAVLVKDFTDTSVTYTTVNGSGIVSLYNGKIAAVGEDHVTINHHNGIVSSYKGVFPTVKVGDTVMQGSPIGLTDGTFTVKLRIGNKLVDIHKLLEVSDENLQD